MTKHSELADQNSGGETVVTVAGISLSGRKRLQAASASSARSPLVITLHGGTYSSAYFDVRGYSLLDKAEALGIPIIALDRPSYGSSTALPNAEATIPRNAEVLDEAIGELWLRYGGDSQGVFLIGHSIGGAIATVIASRQPNWPLLGLGLSGVGMKTTPGSKEQWHSLPEGLVELPTPMKDHVMFGPAETIYDDMPTASHISNTTCPRAELIDIVDYWPDTVNMLAAKVSVPVHYRQSIHDKLWIVDQEQVENFSKAFCASPLVDAALWSGAGHCIDFHRNGAAFQLEQLAFALRCGAAAKM